jgi:lipopolysaccharide/colanic/teichoic acid biosynthesis glycosyltransferase/glycosyltransferase involved in cell wall biosynthesis
MKLVHVATSDAFLPFLEGQAASMRTRGLDVHVVSSPGPLLDSFARQAGAKAWPVRMERRMAPAADLRALWQLWRLFVRLRPDVVHAHTPKAGLLAMLAARLARTPAAFYTIHGLVWQTRRGWKRRLLIALETLACHLAHRVFAVGGSVRTRAIEAGLASPAKIIVPANGSANGVDLDRFDPGRCGRDALRRLRYRYGIPDNAPVAAFVGRIVRDKGVVELEAAWQQLRGRIPDLHLVLIGETEEHDPPPAAVLARLRLDPRVHFTGWRSDMPEHYGLTDVCILPTRREGLPYAALEAAAMARPVAAFAVDGVLDAVEHGKTGLLAAPGDAAALASHIALLLGNPELARALGRAGRARVEALYGRALLWQCIYQQYLDALRAPRLWWKRPLDAAAAFALLALLAPLLAALALAVLLDVGRPVLYRQRRPGLGERPFEILKFRTMIGGAAPDGERLTPLGRLLRRASLDELPQLINILRGEMSFIGPRPLLERYLAFYTAEERRRHSVRPGLTGWAQIHGRNDLPWRSRLAMDIWYVDHACWRLDVRIALRSLRMVFTRQGARADPSASMLDLDVERQGA